MHAERKRLFQFSLVLLDVGVTSVAFLMSYWVRGDLLVGALGEIYPLARYLWIYLVAAASIPVVFTLLKLYEVDGVVAQTSVTRKAGKLFQAMVVEYVLISVVGFTLKLFYVSRLLALLFVGLNFLLLLLARSLLGPVLLRRAQRESLRVVIVGTGEKALSLASVLSEKPPLGISILGFLTERPSESEELEGRPILGGLDDARSVLTDLVVDEVLIAVPEKSLNDLESLFLLCEEQGITARLACDFLPRGSARLSLEQIEDIPLLTFATTPNSPNLLAFKRVMDLMLSSVFLVLSVPLFLIVPILIKLTSKGPVLYKQVRSGLNGRRFTFLKFRSMVDGADEMRKEIEHLNEAMGPVFKIATDPRVTKVGRILRRASIDELPQLFNVLKGEMSLVGPRPPLPDEVEWYQPWQRRRLSMKPGITCLWQVSGRSDLSFNEWVELDLRYIDNWSPWLDAMILLKTVPAVLRRKGAW